MTNKILLVDDDQDLCELLSEFLSGEGFVVDSVNDGNSAIKKIHENADLNAVVLDIMMPEVNGLDVLKTVRQRSEIPIIMLTGRGDDIDRILGLEMGADDYLGKPCNPRELAARLKAILRRSGHSSASTPPKTLTAHNIVLDSGKLQASFNKQTLTLTSAEFKTLELLMSSAGEVLTKEHLTEAVLHRKLRAYDRSIDVHVSRIRQKLNNLGCNGNLIKTVRGVGYQMALGDSEDV